MALEWYTCMFSRLNSGRLLHRTLQRSSIIHISFQYLKHLFNHIRYMMHLGSYKFFVKVILIFCKESID